MDCIKIAFIIHYTNEYLLEENKLYLSKLGIPEGICVELLSCDGENIWRAYNEAIQVSDAKYKVFLKEDTFIVNHFFISDMLKLFEENPETTVFGTKGQSSESSGAWDVFAEELFTYNGSFKTYAGDYYLATPVYALCPGVIVTCGEIKWNEGLSEKVITGESILNDSPGLAELKTIPQPVPWTFSIYMDGQELADEQRILSDKLADKMCWMIDAGDSNAARETLLGLPDEVRCSGRLRALQLMALLDKYQSQSYGKIKGVWQDGTSSEQVLSLFQKLFINVVRAAHVRMNADDFADLVAAFNDGLILPETMMFLTDMLLRDSEWAKATIRSLITDKEKPLVSVVITSYNHESSIRKTIDSVMQQSYQNFELLITDDGSTDKTQQVVKDAIDHYRDSRIVFYPRENNTYFKNIDETFELAKGKYIVTISADDSLDVEKLEKQLQFLENCDEGYKLCFTWVKAKGSDVNRVNLTERMFYHDNRSREEWLKSMITVGNQICSPATMISKELFASVGYQDFTFRQIQDYETWLQILQCENIYIIPEQLTFYGVESGSLSDPKSLDNLVRTYVEVEQLYYETFRNMEDAVFDASFPIEGDGCDTHLDIMCRKVKLLVYDFDEAQYCQAGIRLYYDYRHIDGFKELLELKYDLSTKKIHELVAKKSLATIVYRSSMKHA